MNLQKIYQEIAKKNGLSVQEVKDEMQKALREAFSNRPEECPTIEEFIEFALKKIMEAFLNELGVFSSPAPMTIILSFLKRIASPVKSLSLVAKQKQSTFLL